MSLVNSGDRLSAFPWVCEDQKIVAKGMTLRDYFAAKVLPSMIVEGFPPSDAAKFSYEFADAMLKARGSDGSP